MGLTASELGSLQSWAVSADPSEILEAENTLIQMGGPAALALAASRGRWIAAPHLMLLNQYLRAAAERKITRLAIFMPPRHGKSELTSKYFPAWWLINQPDSRVMLASYQEGFASTWGRKVRDLIQGPIGLQFGIGVRQDSKAAAEWNLIGRDGGMVTAGVGGPVTGKGADLLLIDDPVKNAEEAASPTYRERNWDWYTSTAFTRLEPNGVVVLIQTRWHEDDLGGRILSHARDNGEKWTVLNLPALAEDHDPLGRKPGDALWPARFDRDKLASVRATLGGYFFSALYQQRPTPATGGAFQREWFRRWQPTQHAGLIRLNDGVTNPTIKVADARKFGVLDLAFSTKKEADYTCLGAFGVDQDSNLLLLDLYRGRIEAPKLTPLVRQFVERHKLAYVLVEANGAQLAIVQALRNAGITVRALKAETDKVTRSLTAQVRFEAGQIYLPTSAPWLAEYEAEMLAFPKAPHDDQVDVTSYAALEVFRFGAAPETPEQAKARNEAEARQRAEAYHDLDNDRWWSN
jgi:predicted phage terminase large subunit-like protein